MEKNIWARLLDYSKNYKKNFIGMLLLIIMVGIAEGIIPFLSGWLIDKVVATKSLEILKKISIIYVALIIIQGSGIYWFIYNAGQVEAGMSYEMREVGFKKLQDLSLSFFDKNPIGITLSKLTSDVNRVSNTLVWGLIDYTWGIITMFTMAVLMFVRNWQLALITMGIVPVLFVGAYIFQKIIITKYREVRKINGIITGAYNEGIMGARTVKTLGIEKKSLGEFKSKTIKMRHKAIRAGIMGGIFLPFISIVAGIGAALALWKGGIAVVDNAISYGLFASFIFTSMQFFNPVTNMARVFANLQYARAAGERILDLMDTTVEIINNADTRQRHKVKGNIKFDNVSFFYKKDELVLKNFSIDIKKGETIALVGETGSGKSTIVNLACRFYEPTSGTIYVDGINYKNIHLQDLQGSLGYVLQSPYLFNDTVLENVRFGRLDATEEEIIQACKDVDAHSFIEKLKFGYNTKVEEGGKLLSTGQKQLLSIARAILADPAIFVLDEATSSVDTESEVIIQKAIEKILKGRTSFVVAHRLSTIVHSDRILVVSAGEVIEEGTHRELLEKKGYYHNLYTNQFLQEKEEQVLGKYK